jgi:glycosyltransferase involved in cell wall biosynthesis
MAKRKKPQVDGIKRTKKPLRIHWHSNAPWAPTGYGNQSALFLPRLAAMGHTVTASAFYGLQGSPQNFAGIPVFPGGRNTYGNDVIVPDSLFVKADITITFMDAWVIDPAVAKQVRWVAYMPVDHQPAPPGVAITAAHAFQTIAYSEFGVDMLYDAGLSAMYVPHGVDTKVFKPKPRKKARKALGCPDDVFLVGIVAANKGMPSRKAFDQQIRAFAAFNKRHPDSMLYLHTRIDSPFGISVSKIIEHAEIPAGAIAVPPPYKYARGILGPSYMVDAYGSMDVLLNATKGEGFGIPIIEAQACGTPVIVSDFSAMPELIREGTGWKVGGVPFYSQESYQITPNTDEIEAALEWAYAARGDEDLRQHCRNFVVDNYDVTDVTNKYWRPVLDDIADMVEKDNIRRKVVEVTPLSRPISGGTLSPEHEFELDEDGEPRLITGPPTREEIASILESGGTSGVTGPNAPNIGDIIISPSTGELGLDSDGKRRRR